eukprot:c8880_g1_i1 orf=240-689(+)
MQKESRHVVKTDRADKGSEFSSSDMARLCAKQGIKREFANTDTPSKNSVVEQKNQIVVEMAITMLEHKELPTKFWAEVVATTIHILNWSPIASVPRKTPYEAHFGKKPNVTHFHVFGCDAYVHVPKNKRGSWTPSPRSMWFWDTIWFLQ